MDSRAVACFFRQKKNAPIGVNRHKLYYHKTAARPFTTIINSNKWTVWSRSSSHVTREFCDDNEIKMVTY